MDSWPKVGMIPKVRERRGGDAFDRHAQLKPYLNLFGTRSCISKQLTVGYPRIQELHRRVGSIAALILG